MSEQKLRPLGFGEILDSAFSLYRHNFPTFFATALLAMIPVTLLSGTIENAMIRLQAGPAASASVPGTIFLAFPVVMLLWWLLWAALTRQTAESYGGREVSLRDGYARAARALPALVGAWLLILLLFLAAAIAFGIVSAIAAMFLASQAGGLMARLIMGAIMIAAGVGMFVVLAALFAVVPAIVVERLGPWGAIKRSNQLSHGARGRILGVLFVCSLIVLLPSIGLMMVFGLGTAAFDSTAAVTLGPVQLAIQQLIGVLTGALTSPFMVGCITLLYFDRRVRSEGYDLEVAADNLAVLA